MQLANRVKTLTPSSTLAITAKAKALKQQGYDVIGLGAGEPDFNTPEFIMDAADKAMREGFTNYTPSGGIAPLKEAICNKLARDNNLTYEPSEIIVTTGAKHALYTLFQVLINPGDEVIIPAPYWVSYTEQVKLAGGRPIIVETKEDDEFKLAPAQLEAAITEKTKAIIINSPSNPTGMIYSKEELAAIGEVCVKYGITVVSDEIYEKLIYADDKHVSMAQMSEALKEQTVIVNGVSKSHAMTGWRIGYAAGNEQIIQAMTNLASHSTSNPTSIAQYAALAAYTGSHNSTEQMRQAFQERLETCFKQVTDIPGITCAKPKGAFYLFLNVKNAVQRTGFRSADEWVTALLEEEKVALVPGSGFGASDYVRLSYATSKDLLMEATKRIDRFVRNHQS